MKALMKSVVICLVLFGLVCFGYAAGGKPEGVPNKALVTDDGDIHTVIKTSKGGFDSTIPGSWEVIHEKWFVNSNSIVCGVDYNKEYIVPTIDLATYAIYTIKKSVWEKGASSSTVLKNEMVIFEVQESEGVYTEVFQETCQQVPVVPGGFGTYKPKPKNQ